MSQLNPTEIANTLRSAGTRSERSRRVRQLSDEKGVSAQAIYTAAAKGGFNSGRPRRADAGTRKLPVTDDQLAAVAKIIHQSHTESNRIPLPAHEAIRLAEAAGIVTPGLISESYLNQWMLRRKISKRDALARTPHTPLMTKYPNHVHMIDASQCAQWYINNSGAVAHQRRGMEVYKNKPGDPRKITRTIIVDHYSGAFFVWYHQTETALDWIEFLYLAWADKSFIAERLGDHCPAGDLAALFPFRGMPEMIYADNGSPIKAFVTGNVLDNLGITFDTHMPYHPRAKGANETMQRHWERWFESRLHLDRATSMEELNARAFMACAAINAERTHRRHGLRRFEIWQRDLKQIRDVPEYAIYRTFAQDKPEVRKVHPDGTILFKPRKGNLPEGVSGIYRVDDVNLRGSKVEVSYCLYDFPKVRITYPITGQVWEKEPLYRNAAGFLPDISATIGESFKAPARTESQRAFTELGFAEDKHGLWKSAEPLMLENVHVSSADALPASDDARETPVIPFTLPEETEIPVYTRMRAKRMLMERLDAQHIDDLHPLQRQIIADLPDQVTKPQINTIYDQLTSINPAQIISLGAQA